MWDQLMQWRRQLTQLQRMSWKGSNWQTLRRPLCCLLLHDWLQCAHVATRSIELRSTLWRNIQCDDMRIRRLCVESLKREEDAEVHSSDRVVEVCNDISRTSAEAEWNSERSQRKAEAEAVLLSLCVSAIRRICLSRCLQAFR